MRDSSPPEAILDKGLRGSLGWRKQKPHIVHPCPVGLEELAAHRQSLFIFAEGVVDLKTGVGHVQVGQFRFNGRSQFGARLLPQDAELFRQLARPGPGFINELEQLGMAGFAVLYGFNFGHFFPLPGQDAGNGVGVFAL